MKCVYKVVHIAFHETKWDDNDKEYAAFVPEDGEAALNELGAEGWELVTYDVVGAAAFMKRPVTKGRNREPQIQRYRARLSAK